MLYAWATVATSLLLWPVAGTGLVYVAAALVLGGVLLTEAHRLWSRTRRYVGNVDVSIAAIDPMRLFHVSNLYLALLFVAVALDPLLR